jgi:hypothetical protein
MNSSESFPHSNHLEQSCQFCELIRLLYPSYKPDNSRAVVLILKHLSKDHHPSVDGGEPGAPR